MADKPTRVQVSNSNPVTVGIKQHTTRDDHDSEKVFREPNLLEQRRNVYRIRADGNCMHRENFILNDSTATLSNYHGW